MALTIAGFDPSGGAGVLADLKTFAAHGVYAEACLTTLTIQNTEGVQASRALDAGWITATLTNLTEDNPFSVIKIGALGSDAAVRAVVAFLRSCEGVPVVLDPVFRSSSGAELLERAGIERVRDELLPLVSWVTPNFDELGRLAETAVRSAEEAENAVKGLRNMYPQIYILATGGDQKTARDYLAGPENASGERIDGEWVEGEWVDGEWVDGEWVDGEWVETTSTHGTGCTLSSALAARIALYPAEDAVSRVRACKRYVEGALRHAPGLGKGAGPLNHFWESRPAEPQV